MIEFHCACGTLMRVEEALAGRQGRCPRCGGEVSVPGAPGGGEVLTVGDAGVAEVPAAPAAERRRCPTCGAKLAPGAFVCVQCGTNLETGERLAGGARDLLSVEERLVHRQAAERLTLPRLVRGVLFHPVATLESVEYQLSFYSTMVGMAMLWLGSLVAVGALGALQAQLKEARTWVPPSGAPREIRARIEGVEVLFRLSPAEPIALRPYELERHWPAGKPLRGGMWYSLYPRGGRAARGQTFSFDRAAPFKISLKQNDPVAPRAGPATLEVGYRQPGKPETVLAFDVDVVRPPLPPIEVARLARGALSKIATAVLLLLVWGAVLGTGGRILTGSFRLPALLVVLAFLQGVTNLAYLPFLPFLNLLEESFYLVEYGLAVWTSLLYFVALMHLYDQDVKGAALLVFLAWGIIYVVLFLLLHGGMAFP